MTVYEEIFEVIKARKAQYDAGNAPEKSYTCYLFDKGVDKICKKVGEEAAETIIAAKNADNNELKNEINDLLYHVMVLCADRGREWSKVEEVLSERNEKIGYKIREAQLEKIPYMIVVGEKEQEENTVSLRSRKEGDLGSMPLSAFIEKVEEQVRTKELNI